MDDLLNGAAQFRDLARRLTAAGEEELSRELRKAVRDAATPAAYSVRARLPGYMPARYAATLDTYLALPVSQAPSRVAAVQIRATTRGRRRRLRALEAGFLRHPLFGDRAHWYTQQDGVRPGFFAGPLTDARPAIRDAILAAMARIAAKITTK